MTALVEVPKYSMDDCPAEMEPTASLSIARELGQQSVDAVIAANEQASSLAAPTDRAADMIREYQNHPDVAKNRPPKTLCLTNSTIDDICTQIDGWSLLDGKEEESQLHGLFRQGLEAFYALKTTERLSSVKRMALERQVLAGTDAYLKFYEGNVRLVISNVKYFIKRGTLATPEDLTMAGFIGLARAIEKFDPAKGYKFSTYASLWIKQSMQRELPSYNPGIVPSVNSFEEAVSIDNFKASFVQLHGSPATEDDLLASGYKKRQLRNAEVLDNKITSLDQVITEGGQPASLHDIVGDNEPAYEEIEDEQAASRIYELILYSPAEPLNKVILCLCYGLDSSKALNQFEAKYISELFGPDLDVLSIKPQQPLKHREIAKLLSISEPKVKTGLINTMRILREEATDQPGAFIY